MDKIDKILDNSIFVNQLKAIEAAEKNRKFCLHGLTHLLDVARICHIINLEEALGYDKEIIYAMALLHDIGRHSEYEREISHHEAGAVMAQEILKETGFSDDDRELICEAIKNHKDASHQKKNSLSYILYRADKLSRNCFECKAYEECYWSEDKKNKLISY